MKVTKAQCRKIKKLIDTMQKQNSEKVGNFKKEADKLMVKFFADVEKLYEQDVNGNMNLDDMLSEIE